MKLNYKEKALRGKSKHARIVVNDSLSFIEITETKPCFVKSYHSDTAGKQHRFE